MKEKFEYKNNINFNKTEIANGKFVEFKVFDGEHQVGYAQLVSGQDNDVDFYLENFKINNGRQGEGFGSNLIEQVNHYLLTYNKSAKLYDNIGDERYEGMYERHGWNRNGLYLYFNKE